MSRTLLEPNADGGFKARTIDRADAELRLQCFLYEYSLKKWFAGLLSTPPLTQQRLGIREIEDCFRHWVLEKGCKKTTCKMSVRTWMRRLSSDFSSITRDRFGGDDAYMFDVPTLFHDLDDEIRGELCFFTLLKNFTKLLGFTIFGFICQTWFDVPAVFGTLAVTVEQYREVHGNIIVIATLETDKLKDVKECIDSFNLSNPDTKIQLMKYGIDHFIIQLSEDSVENHHMFGLVSRAKNKNHESYRLWSLHPPTYRCVNNSQTLHCTDFMMYIGMMEAYDDYASQMESIVCMRDAAYVYALWNPTFTNLIKIGVTRRPIHTAIKDIEAVFKQPMSYVIVESIRTDRDPEPTKLKVLQRLAGFHALGKSKLFFTVSRNEVVKVFWEIDFTD